MYDHIQSIHDHTWTINNQILPMHDHIWVICDHSWIIYDHMWCRYDHVWNIYDHIWSMWSYTLHTWSYMDHIWSYIVNMRPDMVLWLTQSRAGSGWRNPLDCGFPRRQFCLPASDLVLSEWPEIGWIVGWSTATPAYLQWQGRRIVEVHSCISHSWSHGISLQS